LILAALSAPRLAASACSQRITRTSSGNFEAVGLCFDKCTTTGNGGAISAENKAMNAYVVDCTITSCEASGHGAAMHLQALSALVHRCAMTNDIGQGEGVLSAVVVRGNLLESLENGITGSTSGSNIWRFAGTTLGVEAEWSVATFERCNCTSSSCGSMWGGLYDRWGYLSIEFCKFDSCKQGCGLLLREIKVHSLRCMVIRACQETGSSYYTGIFCNGYENEPDMTVWDGLFILNTYSRFVGRSKFIFWRCSWDIEPTGEGIAIYLHRYSVPSFWSVLPSCIARSATSLPASSKVRTPSCTRTRSPLPSRSASPNPTRSHSPSQTVSVTPTGTMSPIGTRSESPSQTESRSPSPTRSHSPTVSVSMTSTAVLALSDPLVNSVHWAGTPELRSNQVSGTGCLLPGSRLLSSIDFPASIDFLIHMSLTESAMVGETKTDRISHLAFSGTFLEGRPENRLHAEKREERERQRRERLEQDQARAP
jgi:hypothetical protein